MFGLFKRLKALEKEETLRRLNAKVEWFDVVHSYKEGKYDVYDLDGTKLCNHGTYDEVVVWYMGTWLYSEYKPVKKSEKERIYDLEKRVEVLEAEKNVAEEECNECDPEVEVMVVDWSDGSSAYEARMKEMHDHIDSVVARDPENALAAMDKTKEVMGWYEPEAVKLKRQRAQYLITRNKAEADSKKKTPKKTSKKTSKKK